MKKDRKYGALIFDRSRPSVRGRICHITPARYYVWCDGKRVSILRGNAVSRLVAPQKKKSPLAERRAVIAERSVVLKQSYDILCDKARECGMTLDEVIDSFR